MTADSPHDANIDPRVEYLEKLRRTLYSDGQYAVRLLELPAEQRSVLGVESRTAAHLVETIGCVSDDAGGWHFTWSWGDRICPADDRTGALAAIKRVLAERP